MSSSRPYLIRALHEWILDNQCTPYILVNTLEDGVLVPQDFVNPDGQLVLNISPSAVVDYITDEQKISFRARFGGIPTDIVVPYRAVLGIYAKENQQGMIFEAEPMINPDGPNAKSDRSKNKKDKPSLKIVK